MGSCRKCFMKCLLVHGKKDGPNPIVISFSKVMIHDRFLDYMYIPPKFAPEIVSLAHKEQQVEDKSGKRWTVSLSYVDGHLSFHQGWHTFASDHGITLGDLVTVHYIVGSYFVVQVYGKSGCEKLFPSSLHSNQSKRIKPSSGCDSGVEVNDFRGNKERSSTAQPGDSDHMKGTERKVVEDPCCIGSLRKQDGVFAVHGEREEQMSSFCEENMIEYAAFEEVMEIPCGSQEIDRLIHKEVSGMIFPESRPSMSAVSANESKMKQPGISAVIVTESKMKCAGVSSGLSPEARTATPRAQTTTLRDQGASVGIPGKQHKNFYPEGFGGSVKKVQKELKSVCMKSAGANVKPVKKELQSLCMKSAGANVKPVKKEPKEFNMTSPGGSERIIKKDPTEFNLRSPGGSASITKKEPKEFNLKSPGGSARKIKAEIMDYNNPQNFGTKGNTNGGRKENRASISGGLLKTVKAEVVDLSEPSYPAEFICTVTSDDSFLEMAKNFSLARFGTCLEEDMILLLQGSDGKQWPVMYHKRQGMKVLTSGWKQFRKANRIQTGNKCVFTPQDGSESLYLVRAIK